MTLKEVYNKIRKAHNTPARKVNNTTAKKINNTTAKKILRKHNGATIDVSQEVHNEDENRFFKHEMERERRRLFFK